MASKTEKALDLIFAHNKEHVQELLRSKSVNSSGVKKELRERLKKLVDDQKVSFKDLVRFLDSIEGWGDQSVFLFSAPNNLLREWNSREKARKKIKKEAMARINCKDILFLPDENSLSEIELTDTYLHIKYVKKDIVKDRVPEKDRKSGSFEFVAYKVSEVRAIRSFYWDFKKNVAFLSISSSKNTRVANFIESKRSLIDQIMNEVGLDISQFTEKKVSRAIQPIERLAQTRSRAIKTKSKSGGAKIDATSTSRNTGLNSDTNFKNNIGPSIENYARREVGNFYWDKDKTKFLDRKDMRTQIYKSDQRVAIYGKFTSQEVINVIETIHRNSK